MRGGPRCGEGIGFVLNGDFTLDTGDNDYVDFDFDPRNLPADYLQAIGLVTACSAQTESNVEFLIACLCGLDMVRGAAVTTHMNAPLRDGVARTLAQLSSLPEEAQNDLDDLLDNVNKAFTRRNAYVHNAWAYDKASDRVFHVRTQAKGDFAMDPIFVPLEVLKEDAIKIYVAGIALMNFIFKWDLDMKEPIIPADFRERGKAARRKRVKKRLRVN